MADVYIKRSIWFNITTRILGVYVFLRHGKLTYETRYYYRHTYHCRLVQLKYVLRDYVFKKKYKTITFSGEFAQDLMYVLPFAYWHYKNGTLKKTIGAKYTKELYFFSDDHEERFDARTNEGNYNFEISRITYSHDYNMSKWIPVPLKEIYRNDVYVYDKPILIIANRYNTEWGGPPVSFISVEVLSYLIENLKSKFTIIYNRPRPEFITNDNSDIHDLGEFEWLRTHHPEVLLMEDLFKENRGKANNYNHFQLQVYANAGHFISTHGGTATFASYFGGINIILSKKGPEHTFGCFHTLFPKLSGAKILHAKTDEELTSYVNQYLINDAKENGQKA